MEVRKEPHKRSTSTLPAPVLGAGVRGSLPMGRPRDGVLERKTECSLLPRLFSRERILFRGKVFYLLLPSVSITTGGGREQSQGRSSDR
jgi:hypothetical protein